MVQRIVAKPNLLLYQTPSDDFFTRFNPTQLLAAPIDFAFLDGMHRCECLLRDFLNTERHCHRNSVIALHDCLPIETPMAERQPNAESVEPHPQGMWTGDVWRTALLLKRHRPDLRLVALDAAPTGLVLITNLDPQSSLLADHYDSLLTEMMGWSLIEITLAGYYEQIDVEAEIFLRQPERLRTRLRGESSSLPHPPHTSNPGSSTLVKKARKRGHRARSRLAAANQPTAASPAPSEEETAVLMTLFQQARYRDAELLARSLTTRFPAHGFGWKALGVMLQKQGRLKEALEVKQASAHLLTDDAEAQNNLANALLKMDRFDDAEAAYRSALARQPDYPEALCGLGITLQKLGRLAEAESLCRYALSLRPSMPTPAAT